MNGLGSVFTWVRGSRRYRRFFLIYHNVQVCWIAPNNVVCLPYLYAPSPINCSLENQSPLRVTSMDFIYTIPSPYPPHSYESGMGYSILSFDWNEISYIGSPCVPAAPRPSPLCSPSSPTDPPTGWPHRVRPLFCPHDPSAAETERRVGPGERLCRIPLLLLCAPPSLSRELKC